MLGDLIFYVAFATYVISPFILLEKARGKTWFRNWNRRSLGFALFLLCVEGYNMFLMHLAIGAGALGGA